jgi:hypothetical protein
MYDKEGERREEERKAGGTFSHNELCNNIIMNCALFLFGDDCIHTGNYYKRLIIVKPIRKKVLKYYQIYLKHVN